MPLPHVAIHVAPCRYSCCPMLLLTVFLLTVTTLSEGNILELGAKHQSSIKVNN